MTEKANMSERGRRAIACKGFRWVPGMDNGYRCIHGPREPDEYDDGESVWSNGETHKHASPESLPPDMADPATLGCFEHVLVPEAWGPNTRVMLDVAPLGGGVWVAQISVWKQGHLGTPEWSAWVPGRERLEVTGGALVQALEAAPQ